MQNKIADIIAIIFGCIVIILRQPYAQKIIKFQNEVMGHNYGEYHIRVARYVILVGGIATIVLGLLSVFRVIGK